MKTRTYIEIGMALLIVVLLLFLNRSCNKVSEQKDYLIDLNDTLEVVRNENGEQIAKINILEVQSKKDFTKIKSNDSTIKWLQKTVEEYKGKLYSATVGSTNTHSNGVTETILIHDTDIVFINDTAYVYPIYKTNWKTKWESGFIKATKDSIHRKIKVINEFEMTMGEVKNGWFKKKETQVQFKNLNPNTETTELRTVNFVQDPKQLSIGLQAGYGIGLTDFRFQPYLGVGVQINLIGVK